MLHGVINDTAFRNGYRKFIARWWVYHIIVDLSFNWAVVRSLIARSRHRRLYHSLVRPRDSVVETIIYAFYSELSRRLYGNGQSLNVTSYRPLFLMLLYRLRYISAPIIDIHIALNRTNVQIIQFCRVIYTS